jgi:hypothetical protein
MNMRIHYSLFTRHYHLLLLTRSTNVNIVVIISMAAEKKRQTQVFIRYKLSVCTLFFNLNRECRYRER